MARITENLYVAKAQGNVAKQLVYRRWGNDTHLGKMPVRKKGQEPTAPQEQVRDRFGSAALYAKAAVADPELKKEYAQYLSPGQSVMNLALQDYMKGPKISLVDSRKYTGAPGSTIMVSAKDNFRVAEVLVSIHNAGGELIEQGPAVLNPRDYGKWIYTATQNNPALPGSKITATALDLPENETVLEVVL